MFRSRSLKTFKAILGSRKGEKMCLGIRPEDIYDKLFYTLGPKEGNIILARRWKLSKPLGSEILPSSKSGQKHAGRES